MDQPLNIPTLPLYGRRLIEASAGTGKTFTIAALYVRLILGLGGDAAFNRPLMPNEILVVTFTNAATEELRERIRIRLREARDALLGIGIPDTTLADLLATIPSERHAQQAQQLDHAIRMMDDAAIFTIHGFCQRMLKRHAFDSGARFDVELTSDGSMIFDQAVEDYWRRNYYPLNTTLQHFLSEIFAAPDALANAIRIPLLADVEQRLLKGETLVRPPASIEEVLLPCEQHLEGMAALSTRIRQQLEVEPLRDQLETLLNKGAFKANMITAENLASRLSALTQWCEGQDALLPASLVDIDKEICRLGSAYLQKATKKGYEAPEGPLYEWLDQLAEQQTALPDPSAALMAHALKGVEADIEAVKKHQGILDFNDLLTVLDEALSGPMGERLSASIRRELPVALIDEFQDTDARQYRIFDRIYPAFMGALEGSVQPPQHTQKERPDRKEYALLLIGDPKQAIYAFRNADLFTYLTARHSVEGRYSLSRNFRSTHAVVNAVNALFNAQDNAFIESGLNFLENEAHGRTDSLIIEHAPAPAITWWLPESPESMGADEYTRMMSEATRADIQILLEGAREGRVGFGQCDDNDRNPVLTPLRASDIAILVRTGSEALAVREALERGGIKSVYLSQKASVFDAHEAFWILQLLEAVAQPRQDRLLRAALFTRLLSDDLNAVAALISNERYWETQVERFEGYHRDWQRRGVLAMLRRVMQDFNVAARLLMRENGERSLTDLLHLGELLQSAAQVLEGEQALLRWLHRAMQGSFDRWVDPESLIQRLENDESLVRVVTIHGSKGLEYPLVYLPFICNYREVRSTTSPMVIRHPEHGRVVTLAADKEQLVIADRARLAEDIRLLYVAVTRARYACRVGVAPLYKGRKSARTPEDATTLNLSALGHLLAGGEAISGHALPGYLQALDRQASDTQKVPHGQRDQCIQLPPLVSDVPFSERAIADDKRAPRVFEGHIDRSWWIASYTSLTEDTRRSSRDDMAEPLASTRIDMEVVEEITPVPPPPPGDINNFPRGPQAGTFLHGLLEMVDFNRVQDTRYSSELYHWIERRLERSRFDKSWLATLHSWLMELMGIPLGVGMHHQHDESITLATLDHWSTELEFWLSTAPTYAKEIDYLIRQYEPLATQADYPALAPRHLNGMLRGFIDMVAEVDGRWYLLDWKSNYLGDEPHSYDQRHLAQAMIEHRYDVQYVIYTLALHRLLRSRLPDYAYDRDMGGVLYIFLRGVGPGREGQGVFYRQPSRDLIEALDELFSVGANLSDADSTEVNA